MSKKAKIGQDIINILAQNTIPIIDLGSDESVTIWPEPDPNDVITIESSEDEQDDEEAEAMAEAAEESRPKFVIRHYGLRTEEQARRVEQAQRVKRAEDYESHKILTEEMTAMLDKQDSDQNNNTNDGVESESGKSSIESNESDESNPAPKKYGKIKSSIFDKQLFKQKTKVYLRKLYFTSSEYNDILINGINIKNWQPTFSKFSFAKINGLTSSGHRHLMMSTDSESDTEPDNENHSLGKKSDSSEGPGCSNPACTEHGRGDDESETESIESDLDLKDNLVQDAEGKWHIAVTETYEESTISKLERMYHMKLKMLQSSVYAALAKIETDESTNERTTESVAEGKTSASTSRVNTDSKYPVIIRWHHGGFLNQNAPVDLPHLDDRSLDGEDTAEMSKKQIKDWLTYRTSVENEISRTNKIELKQVATDLRDTFFKIILRILPDDAKEKKLRLILKKVLWDTLDHIARLPGMGEEIDKILRVRPWPEALSNNAMRRVYLILAGYVQDVPEKWVYIRRDYKLEDEPHVDPKAGERVVKNSDVKVVSRSCIHTLNTTENKCTHGAGADIRFKSLDESDEGGNPMHTSTPKQSEPERYEYIKKSDGTVIKHDQIASRNRVAACTERIERIKAEIESRTKDVAESRKADLIRKIVAAQEVSKKRKKRRRINAWAKTHVARQRDACRKASRAKDKVENRAKGKRYMPILEGQSGSSETYESTSSDDSIPEANWERWPLGSTARESTDQATTTNPVAVSNMDGAIGFRRSIRSIKNRLKSTERKEGCTCPSGECKWAGECFSPK